ncbi:MAG: hypothetical protein EOP05_07700 [Proteobacteria bacterium]|nr:MAG: hypothetical protein EOP05_07700 [Pseudomonadota bacterium]
MKNAICLLLLTLTCAAGQAKTDTDFPVGVFKCTEKYTQRQSQVKVTEVNLSGESLPLVEFTGNSSAVAREEADNASFKGIATLTSLTSPGQAVTTVQLSLPIDIALSRRHRVQKLNLEFMKDKLHYINDQECSGDWTIPRVPSPSELPPPALAQNKALYESSKVPATVSDFDELGKMSAQDCKWAYFDESLSGMGLGYGYEGDVIIRRAQVGTGPVKLIANTSSTTNDLARERALIDSFYEHSTVQTTKTDLIATVTGKSNPDSKRISTIAILSLRKIGKDIVFKAVVPREPKDIEGYGFCSRP